MRKEKLLKLAYLQIEIHKDYTSLVRTCTYSVFEGFILESRNGFCYDGFANEQFAMDRELQMSGVGNKRRLWPDGVVPFAFKWTEFSKKIYF